MINFTRTTETYEGETVVEKRIIYQIKIPCFTGSGTLVLDKVDLEQVKNFEDIQAKIKDKIIEELMEVRR